MQTYYNCDTNNTICNIHTIPITDVLTLGPVILGGIGIYIGYKYDYSLAAIILIIILLLSIDIFVHPMFGIPNNLSYYFGLGKRPPTWRSCPYTNS